MAEPDLKRVKEVYAGALERPPQQRQAYVEQACGEDAELRARVEALLEADPPTPSASRLPVWMNAPPPFPVVAVFPSNRPP